MDRPVLTPELVQECRQQFPALQRRIDNQPVVFLDGPGGTQVPQRVVEAVNHSLAFINANCHGHFATSRETDELIFEARQALSDLLGAQDPDTICFGQNMTSLTFALSRAISRRWRPGDEVLVTRLDHDANVRPWVLAARDAGADVRFVPLHRQDCTLDLDNLREQLSSKTRLVAVGCASNAVGTVNPVQDICRWAHDVGALVFLDAVHFAPHALMDVRKWDCDFLACSAYKFFGPHVGVLWGRRELLEELEPYKVRPASNSIPDRWMSGTQNHEGIAGTLEAIEYLADLGRAAGGANGLARRAALEAAFAAIGDYERSLATQLIEGLESLSKYRIWGLTERSRFHERLPTVAITHETKTSTELAAALGDRGFFTWHGNYYALELTESLGLEPEGMLRIGLVHYNAAEEVTRLLTSLESFR